MLLIRAIIRPEKSGIVMSELVAAGFPALTKADVYGRGKQKGITVGDVHYDELPKDMLLIVCNDDDKDDYSQNCVGGETNGTPAVEWKAHNNGQNILFGDGHVKWFKGYKPNDMTFRYDSMHGWQ